MAKIQSIIRKSKEELTAESDKIYRELLQKEMKSKIENKINQNDPAVMKTLKYFLFNNSEVQSNKEKK